MGNRKQTTVNLTRAAQAVKDKYYPALDLKGLLSASLICFEKTVPESEKVAFVRQVLDADSLVDGAVEVIKESPKQKRSRLSSKSG